MSMPGFTAEASLFSQTGSFYWSVENSEAKDLNRGRIEPAQGFLRGRREVSQLIPENGCITVEDDHGNQSRCCCETHFGNVETCGCLKIVTVPPNFNIPFNFNSILKLG